MKTQYCSKPQTFIIKYILNLHFIEILILQNRLCQELDILQWSDHIIFFYIRSVAMATLKEKDFFNFRSQFLCYKLLYPQNEIV